MRWMGRLHSVARLAGAAMAAAWLLGGCGQYVYHWNPAEGGSAAQEFQVSVDGENADLVYLTFPADAMRGVVVQLDEVRARKEITYPVCPVDCRALM